MREYAEIGDGSNKTSHVRVPIHIRIYLWMHVRDINIATTCNYVCLSICLYVRETTVLYQNG